MERVMQTAKEIKSALDNIRYYSGKIYKLARQQFEADASLNDINTQIGTTRFDSLGCIGSGCNWINTYCNNIEVNLNKAVEQDKLLQSEEEDNG